MSPPASIAIPSGWRSRGSLNMPSKKTSALSRDSMGSKVLSHLRAGGTTSLSGWYLQRYGLVWVREPLLGHEGTTVRALVVRTSYQFPNSDYLRQPAGLYSARGAPDSAV